MGVQGFGERSSEALAKPSSDLSEIAVSPCPKLPRMPRFDMFKMSVLRVDQQARRHRERRALGLAGQPSETEWAADAPRAAQDLAGKLGNAGERRGAPGEDTPRPRLGRKRGTRKPV